MRAKGAEEKFLGSLKKCSKNPNSHVTKSN